MIGIYVSVPIACFRKGLAREYLETELIPPPATCYGFLLSLVGETDRCRHLNTRVTPLLLDESEISVVLRTVWRVKSKPLGSSGNTRPDYQQILTDVRLIIWVDSSEETGEKPNLEERVLQALSPSNRQNIRRFGGLSIGESTHMVNEVSLLNEALYEELKSCRKRLYRLKVQGLLGLPVWVDHVGSANTIHAVGDLEDWEGLDPPRSIDMPQIVNIKS